MIDLQVVWKDTCSELEKTMSAVTYMLWIEKLSPICVKDGELVLLAPSKNTRELIKKNYLQTIKECLLTVRPTFTGVQVISDEEKNNFVSDEVHDGELIALSDKEEEVISPFLEMYTFESFVVGESNKLAFHASKAVAENPGSNEGILNLNPLFIYGGVGLGKTHLLHAIGNYITKNFPSKKIIYTPTQSFANEFYAALEKASTEKNAYRNFLSKYNSVDVLMFDDVQFLKKRLGLQEALFHIFNTLSLSGKQIILSSDRPPKEIETLEERVCSRFEGGLLADVGLPNLDMRIAIIKKKLTIKRIFIPDDVIFFIAETIDTNVRELEGALLKVIYYAQLNNKTIPDVPLAREALAVTETQPKKEGIDCYDIISAVCTYFRISQNDILSKKKNKDIVDARMVAVYLCTELVSLPLVTIGQIFGGRHHTTIIHSRDLIAQQMKENSQLEAQIKDIKSLLKI